MPKNIPYYEDANDDGGECPPTPAQRPCPPPPTQAPPVADHTAPPEEGTAAQALQNQIDQSAALAKLLKDDLSVIEKAEKEAKDAIEKYPALKEKLYAARQPLECFRTQDWQRILKNPHAQKEAVDAIVKSTDGAIAKQQSKVDELSENVACAARDAAEKQTLRNSALAEFQKKLGYPADVEALLKDGLELAAKASKQMAVRPATAFYLGKSAVGHLNLVGDIKCPATFQAEVLACLAQVVSACEAARLANAALENATLTLKFEQKKLEALKSGREATITKQVFDLDGKAATSDAAI